MEQPQQKESKTNDLEFVARLRHEFADAIEDVLTHPGFPLMEYHDTALPEKIRNDGRAPAGGYWEDILAHLCVRHRLHDMEEIEAIKKLFLEKPSSPSH